MKTENASLYPKAFEPLDDEEREIMEAESAGLLEPVPREEFEIIKKKVMQAVKNSIDARQNKNKSADKPGSVVDNHSSRL